MIAVRGLANSYANLWINLLGILSGPQALLHFKLSNTLKTSEVFTEGAGCAGRSVGRADTSSGGKSELIDENLEHIALAIDL